ELRDGRRVTGAGAFGPVLVALGETGYGVAPLIVVIPLAAAGGTVAAILTRQGWRAIARHVLSLACCTGSFVLVSAVEARTRLHVPGRESTLLATGLACL